MTKHVFYNSNSQIKIATSFQALLLVFNLNKSTAFSQVKELIVVWMTEPYANKMARSTLYNRIPADMIIFNEDADEVSFRLMSINKH